MLKEVTQIAQHSKLMKKKKRVTASLSMVFCLKAKTVPFYLSEVSLISGETVAFKCDMFNEVVKW